MKRISKLKKASVAAMVLVVAALFTVLGLPVVMFSAGLRSSKRIATAGIPKNVLWLFFSIACFASCGVFLWLFFGIVLGDRFPSTWNPRLASIAGCCVLIWWSISEVIAPALWSDEFAGVEKVLWRVAANLDYGYERSSEGAPAGEGIERYWIVRLAGGFVLLASVWLLFEILEVLS